MVLEGGTGNGGKGVLKWEGITDEIASFTTVLVLSWNAFERASSDFLNPGKIDESLVSGNDGLLVISVITIPSKGMMSDVQTAKIPKNKSDKHRNCRIVPILKRNV